MLLLWTEKLYIFSRVYTQRSLRGLWLSSLKRRRRLNDCYDILFDFCHAIVAYRVRVCMYKWKIGAAYLLHIGHVQSVQKLYIVPTRYYTYRCNIHILCAIFCWNIVWFCSPIWWKVLLFACGIVGYAAECNIVSAGKAGFLCVYYIVVYIAAFIHRFMHTFNILYV